MGLPNNDQYIRGMALENATRLLASYRHVVATSVEVMAMADVFADYIKDGRTGRGAQAAEAVVEAEESAPFKVGDRIQFKLEESGTLRGVRLNGGLDLTLAYLGSRYVIYTWAARNTRTGEVMDGGEVEMSREEFDRRIEAWTGEK